MLLIGMWRAVLALGAIVRCGGGRAVLLGGACGVKIWRAVWVGSALVLLGVA